MRYGRSADRASSTRTAVSPSTAGCAAPTPRTAGMTRTCETYRPRVRLAGMRPVSRTRSRRGHVSSRDSSVRPVDPVGQPSPARAPPGADDVGERARRPGLPPRLHRCCSRHLPRPQAGVRGPGYRCRAALHGLLESSADRRCARGPRGLSGHARGTERPASHARREPGAHHRGCPAGLFSASAAFRHLSLAALRCSATASHAASTARCAVITSSGMSMTRCENARSDQPGRVVTLRTGPRTCPDSVRAGQWLSGRSGTECPDMSASAFTAASGSGPCRRARRSPSRRRSRGLAGCRDRRSTPPGGSLQLRPRRALPP